MTIPVNGWFRQVKKSDSLIYPYNLNSSLLESYSLGGTTIGVASGFSTAWRAVYEDLAIKVYKVGGTAVEYSIATSARPVQISLSFTFSMYIIITYVIGSSLYYYWYNPFVANYQLDVLSGVNSGLGALDDYRSDPHLPTQHYLIYTKTTGGVYARTATSSYQTEAFWFNLPASKRVISAGVTNNFTFQLKTS